MAASRRYTSMYSALATAVLAVSLTACGGGGGGGGGAPQAGAAPKINDQTAAAQLNGAYSAASALYSMGSSSTTLVTKDAEGTGRFSTVDFALAKLNGLVVSSDVDGGNGVATKAVGTASVACIGGGSVTATVDDVNNDRVFGTGDTAVFQFNGCREDGITMSGRMLITQVLVTGSVYAPSYSVGATYAFESLTASSAWAPTVSINGGFSIQASYVSSPATVVSATVAGNSFSATQGSVTDSLSNFSASIAINATTGRYQYSVAGSESNSAVDGSITISNPVPFQGTIGTFPSSGSLRVQASDGSAARLTATSATSVQIDVDANGDGAYESTSTRTWSQLVGA
ncbi:MAG TPA: hypothetical protein PKA20_11570 [Burkholderiaceae bacterium]|nr:hypothetical protein [Burkholderiaceae bacterium]